MDTSLNKKFDFDKNGFRVVMDSLKHLNTNVIGTILIQVDSELSKDERYCFYDIVLEFYEKTDKESHIISTLFNENLSSSLLDDLISNTKIEYPFLWKYLTTQWREPENNFYYDKSYHLRNIQTFLYYTLYTKGLTTVLPLRIKEIGETTKRERLILEEMMNSLCSYRIHWGTQNILFGMVDQIISRLDYIQENFPSYHLQNISRVWINIANTSLKEIEKSLLENTTNPIALEKLSAITLLSESIMEHIDWEVDSKLSEVALVPWLITHPRGVKAKDIAYEQVKQILSQSAVGWSVKETLEQLNVVISQLDEAQADEILDLSRLKYKNSWCDLIAETPILDRVSEDKLREIIKKSKHQLLYSTIGKRTDIPQDIADAISIYKQMKEYA